jgi:hypothetical protein
MPFQLEGSESARSVGRASEEPEAHR